MAIKVGDVNGNAVTSSFGGAPAAVEERVQGTLPLAVALPAEVVQRGEYFSVAFRYTGAQPLQAFQLGLRFDTRRVALVGPLLVAGELSGINADNFGLQRAAQGEVRVLWLMPTGEAQDLANPGQLLFFLTFQALTDLKPQQGEWLSLDDAVLANRAWDLDTREFAFQAQAVAQTAAPQSEGQLWATVQPNPLGTGEATWVVQLPRPMKVRLLLFNALGEMVFTRRIALDAGEHRLPMPELSALPKGVYVWQVVSDGQRAYGQVIKH